MTEQQSPRWYAERAGLNARTDEDRAMASEKLGPFETRDEVRRVLIGHLKDGVELALTSRPGSVAHDFGTQYLYLLYRMAADPDASAWTYMGVQWSVWGIERRDTREAELARVAATPGAVIGGPPPWMQISAEGAAQLASHLRVGIDGAAGAADNSARYRQLLGFVESLVSSLGG